MLFILYIATYFRIFMNFWNKVEWNLTKNTQLIVFNISVNLYFYSIWAWKKIATIDLKLITCFDYNIMTYKTTILVLSQWVIPSIKQVSPTAATIFIDLTEPSYHLHIYCPIMKLNILLCCYNVYMLSWVY